MGPVEPVGHRSPAASLKEGGEKMPDISMCLNKKCPLRDKCYRYRAIPTPGWQTITDFKYDDGCEYFEHVDGRKDLVK